MRISETKEKKIIHRPTRFFDGQGNRIYNSYEHDLAYNPSYKHSERKRVFAKLIDMLPFFLIFLLIGKEIAIVSFLYSIPCAIILGALSETCWGTTLGKKIFKMKVIDDFGNNPGLLKSLGRNLLCLINLFPVFTDYVPPAHHTWEAEGAQMNFSMHLNNKVCKTYIVQESRIGEIKTMLQQGNIKAVY